MMHSKTQQPRGLPKMKEKINSHSHTERNINNNKKGGPHRAEKKKLHFRPQCCITRFWPCMCNEGFFEGGFCFSRGVVGGFFGGGGFSACYD